MPLVPRNAAAGPHEPIQPESPYNKRRRGADCGYPLTPRLIRHGGEPNGALNRHGFDAASF
jgi:hypothetical protein